MAVLLWESGSLVTPPLRQKAPVTCGMQGGEQREGTGSVYGWLVFFPGYPVQV